MEEPKQVKSYAERTNGSLPPLKQYSAQANFLQTKTELGSKPPMSKIAEILNELNTFFSGNLNTLGHGKFYCAVRIFRRAVIDLVQPKVLTD